MWPTTLHLVSWNRPKMTKLVIETIHRNTPREDFLLVVLDNGSDKETTDMLQELFNEDKIDNLILYTVNKGLEHARQQMLLHHTPSDYFVCIDNDCLPPENWLRDQLSLMSKYEDYAAISQRTQVMIGTGNIFEKADENMDDIVDFPHPGGSFRLMYKPAVREVGSWQDNKPGRGTEERYICGKLRDGGYKTGFATDIKCLHLFGTRGENETDRWGYPKDFTPEETGHSDIWHPALIEGDHIEDMIPFTGKELAEAYFA